MKLRQTNVFSVSIISSESRNPLILLARTQLAEVLIYDDTCALARFEMPCRFDRLDLSATAQGYADDRQAYQQASCHWGL
jgi:hypothetical protein